MKLRFRTDVFSLCTGFCFFVFLVFFTPEYKLLFNFPSKAQAWCDFSEDGAEREFQSMNM